MDSLSNEVRIDVQRVLRIKSSIITSTDVLLGVQDLVGGGKSSLPGCSKATKIKKRNPDLTDPTDEVFVD